MKLDIDTPLDSYSLAAMARTEDILGFLVEDLNVVGSKDAFKNILYGVRLIVEGKNRRLSDFSEIINEEDDENIFFLFQFIQNKVEGCSASFWNMYKN